MPTYAIGDIQGCFSQLMQLLDKFNFNAESDTLWFTGDLVNRGPNSLSVLRFIKNLGDKHITVLGNHDLHLIALAYHVHQNDTQMLNEILNAEDKIDLIEWLRHRPLLHHEKDFLMVHAGLSPKWDLYLAKKLAREAESILQNENPIPWLKNMYGDTPNDWEEGLKNQERFRVIINFFTRLRYCYSDGKMDFNYKGEINQKPAELVPWFLVSPRLTQELNIIFGHWAALDGHTNDSTLLALDTGCVWGRKLTALRLEDRQYFSIDCKKRSSF